MNKKIKKQIRLYLGNYLEASTYFSHVDKREYIGYVSALEDTGFISTRAYQKYRALIYPRTIISFKGKEVNLKKEEQEFELQKDESLAEFGDQSRHQDRNYSRVC